MADELHLIRDSHSALEADFLMRVRKLLRLPMEAQLQLAAIHDNPIGGCSIEYTVQVPVQLDGPEYGIADGVTVDEQTSARLAFDATGKLVSSHLNGIDERHLQLVRDQVKKLAASGQIAATRPEATSGGDEPWYVEKDMQGVRRLKRTRMG